MESMDLSGKWHAEIGEAGGSSFELQLPGTVDEAGVGTTPSEVDTHRWARDREFVGRVRLTRDVVIPNAWVGNILTLVLERCHWTTTLSVDGEVIGSQNSLSVAHKYDLTGKLRPGARKLVLEIDNTPWIPLEGSTHHLSRDTQGNWNGVIGRITLDRQDPVALTSVQLFPNALRKTLGVKLEVRNILSGTGSALVAIAVHLNGSSRTLGSREFVDLKPGDSSTMVDLTVELGPHAALWDEHDPVLHSIEAIVMSGPYVSRRFLTFGLRDFVRSEKQLLVNGVNTFLRGSHDACVFPMTGYPPMDTESWMRLFETYREYGLNHFRAHSWCPPEACFEAADRLGIYLQVEGPAGGVLGLGQTTQGNWDPLMVSGKTKEFVLSELKAIQDAYGNHPSLVMVSIGNELAIEPEFTNAVVAECKARDSRQLLASGSNNCWAKPRLGISDDYFVAFMVDSWEGLLRGSYHLSHVGHINNLSPTTDLDYAKASAVVPVPVVTHEVGQYLAYPDYSQIERYTGTMKAEHLRAFQRELIQQGMEGEDRRFAEASGALQVRLYKAEIEAALRTPNLSGFQLLDLKDYPGQSVALCGILDVFGESKGSITPKQWRSFCSEVVPLARFSKYTWTTRSTFGAELLVANYGGSSLTGRTLAWSLVTGEGKTLGSGKFTVSAERGTVAPLGGISVNLADCPAPSKIRLETAIEGTPWANSWDLWVYPDEPAMEIPAGVRVTSRWNLETEEYVREGGRVLFLGNGKNLMHTHVGMFQTNFWTARMFRAFDPPGTLGMVCDRNHPALKLFPNDGHSDWQWFEIIKNSPAVEVACCDPRIRPLVQIIDTYERNLKLGILWEVQFGKGGVLVCTLDEAVLRSPSPVVRQWMVSLLSYLSSPEFKPEVDLGESARALDQVLKVVPEGRENVVVDLRSERPQK